MPKQKKIGSRPVRLDDDLLAFIAKKALAFETPGAAVRRLIGLAPKTKGKPGPAKGSKGRKHS